MKGFLGGFLAFSLLCTIPNITFASPSSGCSYDNQGEVIEENITDNLSMQECGGVNCAGGMYSVPMLLGWQSFVKHICTCQNGACQWFHQCTRTIYYPACTSDTRDCPPCRARTSQIIPRSDPYTETTGVNPALCGGNGGNQIFAPDSQGDLDSLDQATRQLVELEVIAGESSTSSLQNPSSSGSGFAVRDRNSCSIQ